MKATDLIKVSLSIDKIYEEIKRRNEINEFKAYFPHQIFISEDIKLKLMSDGFKVHHGAFDGFMNNGLIIEW